MKRGFFLAFYTMDYGLVIQLKFSGLNIHDNNVVGFAEACVT